MAEVETPNDDVLVLHLSPHHSLDLVRIPSSRKYRIVFAERTAVQRRAFIEVSFEQAHILAAFLGVDAEDVAVIADVAPSGSEPTELPPPPRTSTRY